MIYDFYSSRSSCSQMISTERGQLQAIDDVFHSLLDSTKIHNILPRRSYDQSHSLGSRNFGDTSTLDIRSQLIIRQH